jgi:hypothetical protein
MVTHDEGSSQSRLNREINELVQKQVEGQERVDTADPASNPEDAGTWYYVVDCAICEAVIPFKHAPEGEPVLRFPTMGVRCFQCRTVHTYAADLVSHRKAVAPPAIFDRGSNDARGEIFLDRQENHSVAGSSGCAIVECKIETNTLPSRRDDIAIAAVSVKKRTMIFFLSSCFFAAAWIVQLVLNILHPVSLAAFNEAHSYGPAVLLENAYRGVIYCGLTLFIFGMGVFLVDTCRLKRDVLGKYVLAPITRNAFMQSLMTCLSSRAKTAGAASLARKASRALSPLLSRAATFKSRFKRSPKWKLRQQ